MRERLITLACALGALLLFATLFVRGHSAEPPATRPTTAETGRNGLAGAFRWLQGEGIRTISLRERFDTLARRADLALTGNVLIVCAPAATAPRPGESAALARWVRAGNTLVVLAALSDRPEWAFGPFMYGDLGMLTGLQFVMQPVAEDASKAAAPGGASGADRESRRDAAESRAMARALRATQVLEQPAHSVLVPNRTHPYLNNVRSIEALSDYPPQAWDVKVPRAGFLLALAHERTAGTAALWVRPLGAGTEIVSAFGSVFTNRALGLADNARLLANIVSASLAPGGALLFDDEHQGLAAAYDPAKFYRDARLYATLGVLGAVWLIWVLGSTQLRAVRLRLSTPRETELVRATGLFLARVLRPAAAARRLFENFFRALRRLREGSDS